MNNRVVVITAILLAGLTFASYSRALFNGFVNYDDEPYVLANPHVKAGLTLQGIKWAITAFHSGNWHPLTWISHMLDVRLYGLRPWGHHLTSLLIHTASVVMLLLVLLRATGSLWRSFLVAGIFGVHPLRAESVVWIAERKDVLGAFFWILGIFIYVWYVQKPSATRYAALVLVFALGLAAKPMLVTLPLVFLLLDYWPLARTCRACCEQRLGKGILAKERHKSSVAGQALREHRSDPNIGWRQLAIEKLPLIAVSAASCIVTFLAQQQSGAVSATQAYPLDVRISNSFISYVAYLSKMVWPRALAVFYPYTHASLVEWKIFGAAGLILAVYVVALVKARRYPHLMVGWFWYLGTLIPVIGIVQVGSQALADRYTYIPTVGLLISLAWCIPSSWVYEPLRVTPFYKLMVLVVLIAFGICSWVQAGYWRDSVTLFRRAVAVTTGNYVAHHNLAVALRREGKLGEAVRHYCAVLRIKPDEVGVHAELAGTYFAMGRLDDALREYSELVKAKPGDANVRCGLGELYLMRGEQELAEREFRHAHDIDPDNQAARAHLARLSALAYGSPEFFVGMAARLTRAKKYDEAIENYRKALHLDPDNAEAHANLGALLALVGRNDEAIREYRLAISLNPSDARVHSNLAVALYATGDYQGAWREVRLCKELGGVPPESFVRALSEKMPPP